MAFIGPLTAELVEEGTATVVGAEAGVAAASAESAIGFFNTGAGMLDAGLSIANSIMSAGANSKAAAQTAHRYGLSPAAMHAGRQAASIAAAAIQMADGATEGSTPNGQNKRSVQQNTADNKRRRIEITTPNRVGNNTFRQRIGLPTVIGSELLVHSGMNELQPLAMKVGKNMHATNSVENMLAHMNGSGSISTEFSGWLDCKATQRNTTFMCFRHNLGHEQDLPVVNGPYPEGCFILKPVAGNGVGLPGGLLPQDVDAANPYHHHGNLDTWFSPLNISDYEDMSWNLNKLKLGQGSPNVPFPPAAQPLGLLGMERDAPLYEASSHRQASNLWQNNNINPTNPAHVGEVSAPFRYNMVFNSGEINYNFMNKGDGPLQATVIVYKVKKNNQTSAILKTWSSQGGGAAPGAPGYGVARNLLPAIRTGFLASTKNKFGTDNCQGNVFREEACIDDPCFAFFL